jgi:rubrerythrin
VERSLPRIQWYKPAADVPGRTSPTFGILKDAMISIELPVANFLVKPDSISEAFFQVGIPLVEGAQTAQEHAIGLLQIAAEVEQALMVQYLYAATSISSAPGAPEDYQKKLIRIAVQEMGHLATVQNILLLVGGPEALHLQRDQLRKTSEENPIPFILQPATRESLAEYVAAEMPAKVPDNIKAKVDQLLEIAKRAAHVELHRVGAIYAFLQWIFLPEKEASAWLDLAALAPLPPRPHLTDADLRPLEEIRKFEAQADEWQNFRPDIIIKTAHNSAEAVVAIQEIAAQGEGLDDTKQSHFEQFLQLVDAFDQEQFSTSPLSISPTLTPGNGAEGGEVISHPYTKLWGEVFSRQYGVLVLSIFHALRTPRDSDDTTARRGSLAALAVTGMRSIIRSLCPLLASLPLRSSGTSLAGPPFDLDPALLQPGSDRELAGRHLSALTDLANLYASIENASDFSNHPSHKNDLRNLRQFDKKWHDLLSPLA